MNHAPPPLRAKIAISADLTIAARWAPPAVFNIMLADDDCHDRFFFDRALRDIPLITSLTEVTDCIKLMHYFTENPGYLPDVIFVDMNMPRKSGAECLTELKLDNRLRNIPVVMYSTAMPESMVSELYAAGAHYYMDKSSFSKLSHCIKMILTMLAENPLQPQRDKFVVSVC